MWGGMPGRTRFLLGFFLFSVSGILLYLGPSLAVGAKTPTIHVIVTVVFILTGTLAFLAAFFFWFVSGSTLLNRVTGERVAEVRVLGITTRRKRTRLGTVVAVEIRNYGVNRDHVSIYVRNDEGESIPVPIQNDAPKHAEQMARFFGVEVEEVVPTLSDAERRYRRGVIGFSIGAALVIAVVVWMNTTRYALPIISRVIVLSRYAEDDLVKIPCRIRTFKATTRAVFPGEGLRTVQADGTDSEAEVCTVVEVSFEYEYEGKRFASHKFGRFDNYAPNEIETLTPGAETVCYLNPKWPDQAVLSTRVFYRYGTSMKEAVIANIVFAFLLIIAFGMFKANRLLYLREKRRAKAQSRSFP